MAALDIPARNFLVKLAFTAGVAGLFWLGTLTRRTYLQTIAATRRKTWSGDSQRWICELIESHLTESLSA